MNDSIIVVSGIPRSGTSMVMKMLASGGLDVAADDIRKADRDNPGGYYEYEKVKALNKDAAWLEEMKGKGIKIISHLLHHLPSHLRYKIILIKRDIREVLTSQEKMYARLRKTPDAAKDPVLARKFNIHLRKIDRWIHENKNMTCLPLYYRDVLANPLEQALEIRTFLGAPLDAEAMAGVVNPDLYRNRLGR